MAVRLLFLSHSKINRFPVPGLASANKARFIMSTSRSRSSKSESSSSSSSSSSSYTTLRKRSICEQKIKQSKFIAIAGSISDEQSAHSFLSLVSLSLSLVIFNSWTTSSYWGFRFFVSGARPTSNTQLLGLQGEQSIK